MRRNKKSPWAWVPTLYFAEGLPYVVVMTVSVIMYKRLGINNADIALYTSWLYLPWVIKPLWSPVVDLLKTKRWWIVTMQLLLGAGLAGVAFSIPVSGFFQFTLAFFWLLAFNSATHDIAADGFYMLALEEGEQSFFIGIRSTFYRFAMITGQGLLIILAGFFETYTGLEPIKFKVTAQPESAFVVAAPHVNGVVETGKMAFMVTNDNLTVSTQKTLPQVIDSIKQWVDRENRANGFVMPDRQKEVKEVSWFSKNISLPLSARLKALFGNDEASSASASAIAPGNVGLVGVRLNKSPGSNEEVALNTDFRRGNESIKLVSGERVVFTSRNWRQTAWLLVQLDPKLNAHAVAYFEGRSGNIPLAWSITFGVLAAIFLLLFLYHRFYLPRPAADKPSVQGENKNLFGEFMITFKSFFHKESLGPALAFLLLFRLGESQLVKLASPFMLDSRQVGGLGLTTGEVGLIYGTIGIIALTLGGILGGLLASKRGLKYWLWPMTLAINIPNLVYVYLSYFSPQSMWLISASVAFEQFGYGFGFTAYMLFMIYFAEGKHKTAHFALCTGVMALGMMLPGIVSGWLQEILGYEHFFVWVMICSLPGMLVLRYLKIDPSFGIKKR